MWHVESFNYAKFWSVVAEKKSKLAQQITGQVAIFFLLSAWKRKLVEDVEFLFRARFVYFH